MTIGQKIKEARQRSGLTQAQLAEQLTVSRQAVTKWESDRGIPDIENLKLIARYLNVSLDQLLADDLPSWETSSDCVQKDAGQRREHIGGKIMLYTLLVDVLVGILCYGFLGEEVAVIVVTVSLSPLSLLIWRLQMTDTPPVHAAIGMAVGGSAATMAINLAVYTLATLALHGIDTLHLIAWGELLTFLGAMVLLHITVSVPILLKLSLKARVLISAYCLIALAVTLAACLCWALINQFGVRPGYCLLFGGLIWAAGMAGTVYGHKTK